MMNASEVMISIAVGTGVSVIAVLVVSLAARKLPIAKGQDVIGAAVVVLDLFLLFALVLYVVSMFWRPAYH